MDLLCNSDLVGNITKAGKKMKVQGNGGTLVVTRKTTVPGYKQDVWFSKDAITNIISLKILIEQYRLTYWIFDHPKGLISHKNDITGYFSK